MEKPERNTADLLVECLIGEGVEYIFGIPGEENLALMNAIYDSPIQFITVRHEQGAAFMADVYGRLTGKAGVCLSTLGPGATNLITGVADAYSDGARLVAITGQVGTERMHITSHQFLDLTKMFEPITKRTKMVVRPDTIGEIVPEGKLPLDVGAIVLNCTTLANIARYCRTGMPLVEKCITVDGSAVAKPKNVIVPIGMKLADVFEQAGGFCTEPKKVLYGGPMMGIAVPDLDQPVLKNTNAVLAMTEADAVLPEPTACIRCGRCIRHCPLRLMPSHIVAAYEAGNMERLAELKVNLCMECGCCSFGCPAHRPLVQTNKLAKAKLAAWRKAQSEKLDAKKEAVK